MTRTPLKSSMLRSAGHDGAETLEIEFSNGSVYTYRGVPQEVFDSLIAAPSAGRYFGAAIRGKFPFAPAASHPKEGVHA